MSLKLLLCLLLIPGCTQSSPELERSKNAFRDYLGLGTYVGRTSISVLFPCLLRDEKRELTAADHPSEL